ncbi:protein-export membrane protein SecF [Candidatus Roizmanbacteria bacterium RIFCSPHIGHO2_12_FULL_44_10]|uniref:Protein-export membrane protein SecF n=1 Tax=Candidatus Roizmanbacteria bacterium RIFCSPHIGHO2_12_FULL_44_10 TaxID=1802054 RepID=A0A1F7I859_9BACT|nr:MAG: protein-export membrane protein SecF [Candidatus Roizmanbacteria bacterium RIFCSPHIGHO2_12_FULL_44_10]
MINFLKYTKIYFCLSALIIGIGAVALFSYGFKFSIDFTGGSVVEYSAKQAIETNQIEKAFKNQKTKAATVERSVSGSYIIRSTPINERQEASIREDVKKAAHLKELTLLRFETVGPSLGAETVRKTIIASLVAVLGILIYVSLTFRKFSYGIAAVIALIHDLLVLVGVYALVTHFFGAEIDSLFITAVLTTMSFSVHDTIVVFDKIREYRRTSALSIEILANKALTETMVRSVNNSLTIVLMLIPLVILGTDMIRFFAAALLIGTISGTYSSPFIATPLLVWIEKRREKS